LPKIFRLTKGGKLIEGIFEGSTINTPSMLCVADYLDALGWVDDLGGLDNLIKKSESNLAVLKQFVDQTPWIQFLAEDPNTISNTSVCFTLDATGEQLKAMIKLLESENVAYDIASYRDAPNGLRIWCGATVEESDLKALVPWLQWAYEQALS
jgi:phosphoserine aminotransferase